MMAAGKDPVPVLVCKDEVRYCSAT